MLPGGVPEMRGWGRGCDGGRAASWQSNDETSGEEGGRMQRFTPKIAGAGRDPAISRCDHQVSVIVSYHDWTLIPKKMENEEVQAVLKLHCKALPRLLV
eukprot:745770-Hanusia_phi.AAC.3